MENTEVIDVKSAVEAGGDTPRPSQIATQAEQSGDMNQLGPAPIRDSAGIAFDPSIHCISMNGDPKIRKTDGRFCVKPVIPPQKKKSGSPEKPKVSKPVQPLASEIPVDGKLPGGSTFVAPSAPDSPTPGEVNGVDAVASPEMVKLTPDECRATAQAITDGAIGMARMIQGEHWQASADERNTLIDCMSRLWALYNLPRFGPIVELLMLLVSYVFNGEKRTADMKRLWNWSLGKKPVAIQPAGGANAN